MKIKLPEYKYVITERDVMDILIAFNNQDYDWILYFFETLKPIDSTEDLASYSFDQILANAGITFQGKPK
jgi:hypothetical protein|tara:strand:+ start:351 stop:560 length:210 start_codon:yes stop_codon:yes gene_type:complete